MLNYTSLLKGRMFKNSNLKSSFLIDDKKEAFHLTNKDERNNMRKISSKMLFINKKSGEHMLEKNSSSKLDEDEYLSEDYEDLFLYFLYETEKIDYFEKQMENKSRKNINIKYAFNYIYQLFTDDKVRWNNFLFYEPIYKILYVRSRKMQKEIIQYSIFANKKVEDIINSFNKKYTSKKKVKNWCLNPQEAYKNYEKIILKEKMENEKKMVGNNPYFKDINYTDFVVRTDNNGKGKTLIFLGKAINIYIDDIDKYQIHDNGISMAVEESEFNKKIKNEIVYTFDDIYLKSRKRNWSINNKNDFNNTHHKNSLNKSANKNKRNRLKSNKNSDLKLKNSFKHSVDRKEIKNNNIFKNYNQFQNKLPSITKLQKQNVTERKISKEQKLDSNLHRIENKKIKLKYKNIFPLKEKNKKNKNFINSFTNFEKEINPKGNKTIYNFFSKHNSDFYY
jgi:hypothetical protein